MRRSSVLRDWAAAALISVGILATAGRLDAQGPGVPAPMSFESEGVLACLIVRDVETLLQRLESLIEFVEPGAIQPGEVKAKLAEEMGDPGLKALETRKPIVLWVVETASPGGPPAGKTSIVVNLPVKDPAPYEAALEQSGLQSKRAEGLLAASDTPEGLAAGEKLVPAYRRVEKAVPGADVRIYVRVNRLFKTYATEIEGFTEMIAAQFASLPPPGGTSPGTPAPQMNIGAILKFEVRLMLLLSREVRELQSDLTLGASALTSETTVTAEPGSALEAFAGTPASVPPSAMSLLEGVGPMAASFHFDPRRWETGMKKLLARLTEDAVIGAWIKPEVVAAFGDIARWATGSMAMGLRPTARAPYNFEMAAGVVDEKAYLEVLEKTMALFAPEAALGKLYSSLGMPMTVGLEKQAREHAGFKVHRVKMRPTEPAKTDRPEDAWKSMIQDQEICVVKGHALASQDPDALNRMIDRAGAGVPAGAAPPPSLHSVKTFGAGRLGYIDYEIVGLLKTYLSVFPGLAAGQLAKAKPGEPIAIALTVSDGRALAQTRIPLEPIKELIRVFEPPEGDGEAAVDPEPGKADREPEKKAKD